MPNFKNFRLLKTLNKSLFFFGGEGEGKEWGRGFNFTTGLSFPTIKLAKMYPHKEKVDANCVMKHKHRIIASCHPSCCVKYQLLHFGTFRVNKRRHDI